MLRIETADGLRAFASEEGVRQARYMVSHSGGNGIGNKQRGGRGGGHASANNEGRNLTQSYKSTYKHAGNPSGEAGDPTTPRLFHKCGEPGHFWRKCPLLSKKKGNANGQDTPSDDARAPRDNFAQHQKRTNVPDPGVTSGVIVDEPSFAPPVVKEKNTEEARAWWCFDTASNTHMVRDMNYFVHVDYISPEMVESKVLGIAGSMVTEATCRSTVRLTTEVNGVPVQLFLDDVLYVPGAIHGIFSIGRSLEQVIDLFLDRVTKTFDVAVE
ncbi:hypothetical protein PsorP6_017228 [Peronosclerospora sorghi]|uniref:Uncharacterized protein n=1 Tax=Peronosclerospora sorghi TaxID=230839 RepID=A0ACC0WFD3_9STRA|nr:hypothetical protein PsorP6_017228 [Peronosclerospora sorghi]